MFFKLPIAWLQLKHRQTRLIVAIAGISFAVVLMFMQLGFRAALFKSSVQMHSSLQGDFFLISPRSTALIAMMRFSERRLYQTLAFPEVDFIAPVYLGFAQWKKPDNSGYWRNIHVIGFDINRLVFDLPGVEDNIEKLKMPDVVLFDENSRPEYGEIAPKIKQGQSITTEIDTSSDRIRRVEVVGLFKLGTSFGVDGNLITSHVNFLRLFPYRNKRFIEVGLIKAKPRANLIELGQKLRRYLPRDVRIFSKQELIEFEKKYWMTSTAIGFIFDLGVAMGLIVGIAIVYQILYTDVSDHLIEYATLNAMGYNYNYLLYLVFQEAAILAIMGYIPGFIVSSAMYKLANNTTLLPIEMESIRCLLVLLLTFIMCFMAGIIATKKMQAVDPADIF